MINKIKFEKLIQEEYKDSGYDYLFLEPKDSVDEVLRKIKFHTETMNVPVRVYNFNRAFMLTLKDEEFSNPVVVILENSTKKNTKVYVNPRLWSWYEFMRDRGLINNKLVELYEKLKYNVSSHLIDYNEKPRKK